MFCRSLFCLFILFGHCTVCPLTGGFSFGHCTVCPSTGGFSLSVWLLQTFLDNRIKYIFRFIIPKYRFSYQKDMFINNLFTSELCNELFTSPVLLTGCTILCSHNLIILIHEGNTVKDIQYSRNFPYAKT